MKNKEYIDIDSLINLSGFQVTDDEKEQFISELQEFLKYAKILNSSSCNDLAPLSHAIEKEALQRDDEVKNWDKLELILNNGPLVEKTSYIVPPQKKRKGGEKRPTDQLTSGSLSNSKYEAVIGLEVHAQLKTRSKLFCSCSTEFGRSPNSNTCPVCSGQPGVLPVLNKEAVNMAIKMGLATNCRINKRSVFARKNYFYPDLPKAYQISQLDEPICSDGLIELEFNNSIRKIRLNRIHMEEDAGKMVHIGAPGIWGSKASAVDFNRTSIPLIEIVSEPDIRSGKEAKEYVIMLRAILLNLGICDGNMEEGSLRCDANISIRNVGEKKLGTKTEVKNMNSFKAIEKAVDFEISRQKQMISSGTAIVQQTRLWDESSQKTHLMRTKEEAHDYRYFPDPDLLPLTLNSDLINSIKRELPLPLLERKKIFLEKFLLNENEAILLITNPDYSDFFEETLSFYNNPRNIANWFFNEILSYGFTNIKTIPIKTKDLAEFLKKIDKEEISGKIGKSVIKRSFETNKGLIEIIEKEGLKQITDKDEIKKIIINILNANKKQVIMYKEGKSNMLGFFIGQVMKETKGHANPKLVNKILIEELKNL